MWIEAVAAPPGTIVFQSPASESSLIRCTAILGHSLPTDLSALLRKSNGIEDEYGDELIWPAERIASN